MIKKTITYSKVIFGANNEATTVRRTEDFYFNLNRAEALEINLMEDLEALSQSTNPRAIIPVFKRIIHYAHGVKTPTGKFTKDPEETTDFLASDAYAELFLELLGQGEQGVADFVNKVIDFERSELKQTTDTLPGSEESSVPAGARQPQDYKSSAREIAARQQAIDNGTGLVPPKNPEAEVGYKDPADKYRVEDTIVGYDLAGKPTTDPAAVANDEDRAEYAAWRAQRAAAPAVTVVPTNTPNEETAPQIIERDDEATVAAPAFESRRDLRQG